MKSVRNEVVSWKERPGGSEREREGGGKEEGEVSILSDNVNILCVLLVCVVVGVVGL